MSRTSLEASNIKFISWAPQNDVLGHSAVEAFVTHAGSNSIYEAGFHGKPVVCIPLLADQFDQAARVSAILHQFPQHTLLNNAECGVCGTNMLCAFVSSLLKTCCGSRLAQQLHMLCLACVKPPCCQSAPSLLWRFGVMPSVGISFCWLE